MSLRCLAPIFIAMTSSAAVAEGYPATTKSACEQEQFPSGNTAANIKTETQKYFQQKMIHIGCLLNAQATQTDEKQSTELDLEIIDLKRNMFVIAKSLDVELVDDYAQPNGDITDDFAKDLISISNEVAFWPLFLPHVYMVDPNIYSHVTAFANVIKELEPDQYDLMASDLGIMSSNFKEKYGRMGQVAPENQQRPKSPFEMLFSSRSYATVEARFRDETPCYLEINYQAGSKDTPYFPANLDI